MLHTTDSVHHVTRKRATEGERWGGVSEKDDDMRATIPQGEFMWIMWLSRYYIRKA